MRVPKFGRWSRLICSVWMMLLGCVALANASGPLATVQITVPPHNVAAYNGTNGTATFTVTATTDVSYGPVSFQWEYLSNATTNTFTLVGSSVTATGANPGPYTTTTVLTADGSTATITANCTGGTTSPGTLTCTSTLVLPHGDANFVDQRAFAVQATDNSAIGTRNVASTLAVLSLVNIDALTPASAPLARTVSQSFAAASSLGGLTTVSNGATFTMTTDAVYPLSGTSTSWPTFTWNYVNTAGATKSWGSAATAVSADDGGTEVTSTLTVPNIVASYDGLGVKGAAAYSNPSPNATVTLASNDLNANDTGALGALWYIYVVKPVSGLVASVTSAAGATPVQGQALNIQATTTVPAEHCSALGSPCVPQVYAAWCKSTAAVTGGLSPMVSSGAQGCAGDDTLLTRISCPTTATTTTVTVNSDHVATCTNNGSGALTLNYAITRGVYADNGYYYAAAVNEVTNAPQNGSTATVDSPLFTGASVQVAMQKGDWFPAPTAYSGPYVYPVTYVSTEYNGEGLTALPETFERATLLPTGDVFAIGDASTYSASQYVGSTGGTSINIFHPSTAYTLSTWGVSTPTLASNLQNPSVTAIPNGAASGAVLIVGGYINSTVSGQGAPSNVAQIFVEGATRAADTITTVAPLPANKQRDSHVAVLLANGKVLVTGGNQNGTILTDSELYTPSFTAGAPNAGAWSGAAAMGTPRYRAAGVLLQDGTVLVTGGQTNNNQNGALATAEIYTPNATTGAWAATCNTMTSPRYYHTATVLANGSVLIAGGINNLNVTLNSAEIFDPTYVGSGCRGWFSALTATGTEVATTTLFTPRAQHTATLQADGTVLLAGGTGTAYNNTSEIFDPTGGSPASYCNPLAQTGGTATCTAVSAPAIETTAQIIAHGLFGDTAYMLTARDAHAAVLLQDGTTLAVDGSTGASIAASPVSLDSAERFNGYSGVTPQVPAALVTLSNTVSINGSGSGSNQTGVATCASGLNPGVPVTYTWSVLNGTLSSMAAVSGTAYSESNQIVYAPITEGSGSVTVTCTVTTALGISSTSTASVPYDTTPTVSITAVDNTTASNYSVHGYFLVGDSVTINTTLGGFPTPATASWNYHNTAGGGTTKTNIATGSSYTFTAALNYNPLQFYATVSTEGGTGTSGNFQPKVYLAPSITTNLSDSTACLAAPTGATCTASAQKVNNGGTPSFAVVSAGFPTPAYQWYYSATSAADCRSSAAAVNVGAQIAGATSATLTATGLAGTGVYVDGNYFCASATVLATGTDSSVVGTPAISAAQQLWVYYVPTIGTAATEKSIFVGGSTSFSASISTTNAHSEPTAITWYYKATPTSTKWSQVPTSWVNTPTASTSEQTILTITAAPANYDNIQFMPVVTSPYTTTAGGTTNCVDGVLTGLPTGTFCVPAGKVYLEVLPTPTTAIAYGASTTYASDSATSPVSPSEGSGSYYLIPTIPVTGEDVATDNQTISCSWSFTPTGGSAAPFTAPTGDVIYAASGPYSGNACAGLDFTHVEPSDAGAYTITVSDRLSDDTHMYATSSGTAGKQVATSNSITINVPVGWWTSLTALSASNSIPEDRFSALSMLLPCTASCGTNSNYDNLWVAGGMNRAASSPLGVLPDSTVATPTEATSTANISGLYESYVPANDYNVVSALSWTAIPGSPTAASKFTVGPHYLGTATLLPNGQILVVGGQNGDGVGQNGLEVYNPSNATFTSTSYPQLAAQTTGHTAVLLPDGAYAGDVLIAGGTDGNNDSYYSSAQIYDPVAKSLTGLTSMLSTPRAFSTASVLPDGSVLIAGGQVKSVTNLGITNAADLFDATGEYFTAFGGSATISTFVPVSTALTANTLTKTGGGTAIPLAIAGTVTSTTGLNHARVFHTATVIPPSTLSPNGAVLLTGGMDNTGNAISNVELFLPYSPNTSVATNGSGLNSAYYNSARGVFVDLTALTGTSMASARMGHSATLTVDESASCLAPAASTLPDVSCYKVLLSGGSTGSAVIQPAEILTLGLSGTAPYITLSTRPATNLVTARQQAVTSLLSNGNVVTTGGENSSNVSLASSEYYVALDDYSDGMYAAGSAHFTALPSASISSSNGTFVSTNSGVATTTLSVTNSDPNVNVFWTIPEPSGTITATGSSATFTANTSTCGSYTPSVLVTDEYGFSAYGTITITVEPGTVALYQYTSGSGDTLSLAGTELSSDFNTGTVESSGYHYVASLTYTGGATVTSWSFPNFAGYGEADEPVSTSTNGHLFDFINDGNGGNISWVAANLSNGCIISSGAMTSN